MTTQTSQDVEIDEKIELNFDVLNTGSCFCAYSFLCDDAQLLQKFVAKTNCVIESISRDDIFTIAKKHYQLADKLDSVRHKFYLEETDFDFFRFKHERVFSDRVKN